MTEKWKPIPSTNNKYFASNLGRIKNNKTNRILKQFKITHGYMGCQLLLAREKQKIVHRLVAEAFLPDFSLKKEVNHKDFIKSNNVLSNLEMATHSENMAHYSNSLRTFKCLRCLRSWKSRTNMPSQCRRCASKTWNIEPTRCECKKCGYSWIKRISKRSTQCKCCGSSLWDK